MRVLHIFIVYYLAAHCHPTPKTDHPQTYLAELVYVHAPGRGADRSVGPQNDAQLFAHLDYSDRRTDMKK